MKALTVSWTMLIYTVKCGQSRLAFEVMIRVKSFSVDKLSTIVSL